MVCPAEKVLNQYIGNIQIKSGKQYIDNDKSHHQREFSTVSNSNTSWRAPRKAIIKTKSRNKIDITKLGMKYMTLYFFEMIVFEGFSLELF